MADGGIMEAALLSAAIGGGTSLATGQDPLKGALLGAVTGGAMSGIGGALGAAGSAGADVATTGANSALQTGAGLTSSIPGTTGASMLTEALPQVATAVPESLGGMSNAALTQGAGINALPNMATEQLATQIPQAAAPATQGGIRGMLGMKPGSMASQGMDWWDKQDTLTQAGLGGMGMMGARALMASPNTVPETDKYKSKLAGYNRDSFTPDNPQPEMPYYQARYAQGGIAALAGPQGGMYPQSQQANTQYATPSQMPTSSEVVNSGYEAQTNPYTGEPVGYAGGGGVGSLGGYAHGGNPRLLDGPGTGLSDSIPATIGHKQPARLAAGEFVVSSDVVSNLGGGSTDAGAKKLYEMMDRIRKQAHGTKKQIKPINDRKALPA